MPLQLPNLDDRTYNDLVQEALTLIPANAPEWTNYNPSDPGITLAELFAWLTEMLIYRANRIPPANIVKFLKLLNGPDWVFPANADIHEQVRETVTALRERNRAVSQDDYNFLSVGPFNQWLQCWQAKEAAGQPLGDWWKAIAQPAQPADHLPSQIASIARVQCVPQRNLDAGTEAGRGQVQIEHLSMVILPVLSAAASSTASASILPAGPQPSQGQVDALLGFLDERRILTTRTHAVGPWYVPVGVSVVVARRPDARDSDVQAAVQAALANFLASLPTATSPGWAFGRDVYLSEVYDVLEQTPGLDFATGLLLTSAYTGADPKCVIADSIWNDSGELVGLKVKAHQLPFLDTANLHIAVAPSMQSGVSNVVILQLGVTVTLQYGADRPTIKRQIRAAVNSFFLPFFNGPKPGGAAATIILADVESAIKQISGVVTVSMVAESSPTAARQVDARGVFIQTAAGQVIDLQLTVAEKG